VGLIDFTVGTYLVESWIFLDAMADDSSGYQDALVIALFFESLLLSLQRAASGNPAYKPYSLTKLA